MINQKRQPEESINETINKTTGDNQFNDLLKELMDIYEYNPYPLEQNEETTETPPSTEKETEVYVEAPKASTSKTSVNSISSATSSVPSTSTETSTRQLRPRTIKTTPAKSKKKRGRPSTKKKQNSNKIKIISNVPYDGEIPQFVNPFMMPIIIDNGSYLQQNLANLPIVSLDPGTNEYTLISDGVVDLIPSTSAQVVQQQQQIIVEETVVESVVEQEKLSVKKQFTPLSTRNPLTFAEARSKSTPRRKASHIRALDFNKPSSITKSFPLHALSTPISNGMLRKTPGSAPPSCVQSKVITREPLQLPTVPESMIDESSNSNSTTMSVTPKVGKSHPRRRIVDAPEAPCDENETAERHSLDDWQSYRSKDAETLAREQNREKEEKLRREKAKKPRETKSKKPTEDKSIPKRKTPAKKRKSIEPTAVSPESESNNEETLKEKPQTHKVKIRITPKKTSRQCSKTKKKSNEKELKNPVKVESKETTAVKTKTIVIEDNEELDRTVQEVATTLTTLHETIPLRGGESAKKQPDMMHLETPFKEYIAEGIETPFKDVSQMDFIPNTPRFAIPISSETPMPKIFSSTNSELKSLIKCTDIMTPSFPITPGAMKETPPKDLLDGTSPAVSGYSRKTDYSSSSSYYKPDESEDVDPNFAHKSEQFAESDGEKTQRGKASERLSASESEAEKPLKIVVAEEPVASKVECSVAIERVRSFTENDNAVPCELHYKMMEEGVISESFVTTTEDSSGSYGSSFTCSTCTTSTSTDDENSVKKLIEKETVADGNEKEWKCHQVSNDEVATSKMIDENTGEVRFPLRNWITPKKIETENAIVVPEIPQPDPNELERLRVEKVMMEQAKMREDLQAKKDRVLSKLKKDSAQISKSKDPPQPAQPRMTKMNLKNFKIPPEMPKAPIASKKDEILNANLKEREIPSTLKVLPTLPSSSRRKSATPKKMKTMIIDEIPRQQPSPVKERKKKEKSESKSSSKSDRLSLVLYDNAVMPDTRTASLSISSSFEEEKSPQKTYAAVKVTIEPPPKSAYAQANPVKFMEDGESESSDESSDDEDLSMRNADEEEIFKFKESESFQPSTKPPLKAQILPMILKIEGRTVDLKDSGNMEIFTFEPRKTQIVKKSSKKASKVNNENGNTNKNGKPSKKDGQEDKKR